jgi:transposase
MRLTDNVVLQFCLAHFIRDVKFLVKHPNNRNHLYGSRLLDQLRKLFHAIHRRDEYSTEERFEAALTRIRDDLVYYATRHTPATREAKNLKERFLKHEESFFTFISTPGVDPTNNLAEQAIRFVAIHRRMTQGTRSRDGQLWWERICTAIATCTQQGRSVFQYIEDAVRAHLRGKPAPSLIPDTS